jgi:hypothetical protein
MSADLPLTGGCQCGAVRYEVSAAPSTIYVCHCGECRKQSASAFGVSVFVPRAAFRIVSGSAKLWERAKKSGGTLACAFCAECGSRLWDDPSGAAATGRFLCLKGGALDAPVDLGAAVHIWTSRKLPGVVVPEGARQFAMDPA